MRNLRCRNRTLVENIQLLETLTRKVSCYHLVIFCSVAPQAVANQESPGYTHGALWCLQLRPHNPTEGTRVEQVSNLATISLGTANPQQMGCAEESQEIGHLPSVL